MTFQRRLLDQVGQQSQFLLGFEIVAMPAHQRHQSAVLGADRIDLPPAGQEVVVDQADHMEPVGHDQRVGEVFSDDGTVDRRQVHTDHQHLLFAFQMKEIRFQRRFRAAQRDVVDAVILQIAEGGGIALLAGEEVLIDAQNLGAQQRMVLADLTLQAAEEVALHGSGPDAPPPAETTPVDAVQVLLKHHLLETLTGALEGLNAGNALAETSGRSPDSGSCGASRRNTHWRKPQSSCRTDLRHQPLFLRREPRQCGHDIGPACRADIVIVPPHAFYRGNLVLGQT